MESWFSERIASPANVANGDGVHPEEAFAFRDYLRDLRTANEAARIFTSLIIQESDPSANSHRLAALLCEALTDFSNHTGRIIDFIHAVYSIPITVHGNSDGQPRHSEIRDMERLLNITWMWFDLYRDGGEYYHSHKAWHAKIEARLCSERILPLSFGWLDVGYSMECSEGEPEIDVPVAWEWITTVGRRLYDGMVGVSSEAELYRLGGRDRERGNRDYLVDGKNVTGEWRWSFWKGRLRQFAATQRLSSEARRLACECADEMDKINPSGLSRG